MSDLGTRLRKLRRDRRLTQADVAHSMRNLGLKTTQVDISRWESGTLPQLDSVAILARVLEVSTDYLLGLEEAA